MSGAFDGGHIRGRTAYDTQALDFHQLELTKHAEYLEEDYRLFREEFGLTSFRDGAYLKATLLGPRDYNWDYLDRLAKISHGQISLSLCHYEWPSWIDASHVLDGAHVIAVMSEFAAALSQRYRDCFASYIPVVECGYWIAMITHHRRWWPGDNGLVFGFWDLYPTAARMLISMARAIKTGDPKALVAVSEPWAWDDVLDLDDLGRSINSLIGRYDPVALREMGQKKYETLDGQPDLLDVVGLNFYNNWGEEKGYPLSRLLLEARRKYPDKRICISETGNCQFANCRSIDEWLELITTQVDIANDQGAAIESVTWAPILAIGAFEDGLPAPGAWVTWDINDPARKRKWNPEVTQLISTMGACFAA